MRAAIGLSKAVAVVANSKVLFARTLSAVA